jgi:acyl-CoA thioesterase YciA
MVDNLSYLYILLVSFFYLQIVPYMTMSPTNSSRLAEHQPAVSASFTAANAGIKVKTAPQVALPVDKELVLKVIPMPGDCNANGDIFGGWVMAQVDLAGSVIPARHTQGRMATVAVNEFIFKQPVRVGDILSFFSELTRIGRTSITVKVEVFAERFINQGNYIKVTEALLTYVAIDELGQPREIVKK